MVYNGSRMMVVVEKEVAQMKRPPAPSNTASSATKYTKGYNARKSVQLNLFIYARRYRIFVQRM